MVAFPLSRLFPSSSISHWLIVLLALFLAGLFVIVAFTISGLQDRKFDALVIDLAGRQGMLQQRHMKEILLVRQGIKVDYFTTRAEWWKH
jgi:ABC-type proline/glycine betaine transport system permease subunit